MEELIRVNTFSEKRAYKTLVKGLSLVGLTINDLVNMKQIIETNRVLEMENLRLKNELKALSGKESPYTSYLSQKEELK